MAPRERPPYSSDRDPPLAGEGFARAQRAEQARAVGQERSRHDAQQERQRRLEQRRARSGGRTARQAATTKLVLYVVDDDTGKPVEGVKLAAMLADGSTRQVVTAKNGTAELAGIPEGANALSSPLDGAVVWGTLAAAAQGAQPASEEAPPPLEGTFVLAQVKAHKVKAGDTLASLAAECGLDEAALAKFNWGTSDPAKLDGQLADVVGCTKKGDDGHFVFDDTDEPGIVHLPRPWTETGVRGGALHPIYVHRIARQLPDLKFLYQIETGGQFDKNDLLTLQAEDGSWKHELAVGGLSEVEPGWVELVFPRPPAGVRFHLVQDPRDGQTPFYVFKGASYGELRAASAQQQEE